MPSFEKTQVTQDKDTEITQEKTEDTQPNNSPLPTQRSIETPAKVITFTCYTTVPFHFSHSRIVSQW